MRLPFFHLLGAALACGSPTEPSLPSLRFTGVFQTATTGYALFGTLSVPGPRTLRIDVDAHGTDPGFPFPTQNYYRTRIRDLPPGDYGLSVYHKDRNRPEVPGLRVYNQLDRVP